MVKKPYRWSLPFCFYLFDIIILGGIESEQNIWWRISVNIKKSLNTHCDYDIILMI